MTSPSFRIVLIKGPSMYEGTRTFVDQAAAAFARRGYFADVVDLAGPGDPVATLLAAAERGPTGLVFSINIMSDLRDARGRTMAQVFGAPHAIWFVDYVLSQEVRLAMTPAETTLLLVDPTQVDAVQDVFGAERFPNAHFLPHAAIGEATPPDEDPEIFAATRPIPILWSGTLQKPEVRPWAGGPASTRQVFDDALDLALAEEWMPPHVAMDAVLAARGLDLADPSSLAARVAARWIDVEVRRTRRYAFVQAVAATGLPLHICGAGWGEELERFSQVNYWGALPMPVVGELMRQSRIVLNTNGNFGAGSHERPLSALLAGAAAFSDRTAFYVEALGEGEGIALFRWQDLDSGMDQLVELHASPERALAIAQTGQAKVAAGHTFDARVDAILAAAGVA